MPSIVTTGFLFLLILVLIAHRGSRLASAWGAAWGLAAGLWFLTPAMLNLHHLLPSTLIHWTILSAYFSVVFAAMGGALAFLATAPVGLLALALRRESRHPAWSYALWSAVSLPPAYYALAALIEWQHFGHPMSDRAYLGAARVAVVWYVAIALLSAILRRRSTDQDARVVSLRRALLAVVLLGAAAVPFRLTTRPPVSESRPEALVRRTPSKQPAPLLVIGLDGGNWRTLRPVLERGGAPTLSRLIATGLHGDIEALWPPYLSPPAWSAILTGYSQEETGIHQALSATAPGLPPFELPLIPTPTRNPLFAVELAAVQSGLIKATPTPREQLRQPPIWERLSRAGVKTAVVRFPFTYPATGQADYVISNRATLDLWGWLGVEPGDRDKLIEPVDQTDKWLQRLSDDEALDPSVIPQLLGPRYQHRPVLPTINPVEVLLSAADGNQRMHFVARELVRHDPTIAVLMIHEVFLDEIAHAFWQYRFPEDFPDDPPLPRDIAQLGQVMDRVVELLDRQLADLIESFPSPPNVLIVADHGEGPSNEIPPWKGWHASPGIFIAAGPDIAQRREKIEVGYYDIVPTILELERFEKPSGLRGRSVITVK